uniref:Uncharacterized protein n=1 Tax=Macrostomum lignano TaxID=282301 RepID=A0A1I8JPJ1_9PLAT
MSVKCSAGQTPSAGLILILYDPQLTACSRCRIESARWATKKKTKNPAREMAFRTPRATSCAARRRHRPHPLRRNRTTVSLGYVATRGARAAEPPGWPNTPANPTVTYHTHTLKNGLAAQRQAASGTISLQNLSAEFPEIYSRYEAFRCYHREKKRRHPTEPDEVAAAKIACPDVCESEVSRLLSDYLGPDAAQDPASLLASSLRRCAICHWTSATEPHPSVEIRQALKRCARLHEFVRRHFLLLKVYPPLPHSRLLQVERSFLPPQLLSRIGGSLGLWLGTSLISLFEYRRHPPGLRVFRCLNGVTKLIRGSAASAPASPPASAPLKKLNCDRNSARAATRHVDNDERVDNSNEDSEENNSQDEVR